MKSEQRINWLAWWQLLRVANVFTAASNVIAGFLLVQRDWQPIVPLLLLVLTSILLYEAGMVLNDVSDAELDAIERPERPIPSGRIQRGNAYILGLGLLGGGIFASLGASLISEQFLSTTLALALVLAIVAYNIWANSKRIRLLVMGACRTMNVLLGASVAGTLTNHPEAFLLAVGVGIYTVGLTMIARRETESSHRNELLIGAVLIHFGLIAILLLPVMLEKMAISLVAWIALACVILGLIGNFVFGPLSNPSPVVVQRTVGRLIQMFLVIDATVCALAAGWLAAILVLSLFIPMRLIARWTPMT